MYSNWNIADILQTLTSQAHCVLQSSLNVSPCIYVVLPTMQLSKKINKKQL